MLRAIDLGVPCLGALASATLAVAGLTGVAIGAVCGTVIASASWGGLHLLGQRLVQAGGQSRILLAIVMGLKLIAISALVFVTVMLLGINGIGVAVGLSAMPLSILLMVAVFGAGNTGETQAGTKVRGDA